MAPAPNKAKTHRIHELASLAYERELANALGDLETTFARWRRGEITRSTCPRRFTTFTRVCHSICLQVPVNHELVVARAIHEGIISKEEVGPDTLKQLAGLLASFDGS